MPGSGVFRAALPVAGRRVLVVGGGPAALPTIAALHEAGALVTVVDPAPVAAVEDLAERELITLWTERDPADLEAGDLDGYRLLVAATQDVAADARAAEVAERAGVFWVPGAGSRLAEPGRPSAGSGAGVGEVILVGGGPGDPGLLTVAGLAALRSADVVVTDRLAPLASLAEAPQAEIVDVSKVPGGRSTPQHEINRLLVEHARAGRTVVRFKGGDNFVFGRGGEEVEACLAAGVRVRVIPGVTSAVAGPALAGIPVTHRGLNQGFTVVSGHLPPGDPGSTLDYAALARGGTDLVLMMAVRTLPAIAAALLDAGLPASTPAATVADAGLPSQRVVRGTLATIATLIADAGIRSPAITVIGAVAGFDPAMPAGDASPSHPRESRS
jgi:uroporphyrin-III C-methyltransferase